MPEDRVSGIADTIDELFGLHPSTWTLVRKTADTILRLAEIGNVILIGRGANILTDRARATRSTSGSSARSGGGSSTSGSTSTSTRRRRRTYVRSTDQGRSRYVTKYYGKDIDDPLLYHLVINTDRVPYAEAARMIAEAVSSDLDAPMPVTGAPALRAVARPM